MSHLPDEAMRLARLQHGVISIEQLAQLGVGAGQRRGLVVAGTLGEIHRGVYRFMAVADSLALRCAAACLAVPDLVICGPTAGRLLGLRRMPAGPVHTLVFRRAVELEDVIVHRTNALHPQFDVLHRPDGIRILVPARLVFDLARFLDDDDFESVVEQVLDRKMTTVPTMFATGRRLRKPGRDGSARFGRVLGRRPAWSKPKGSDLEVRLLRALAAAGVTLQAQHAVELPDGDIVHLDGGDPARRFGVEVDHVTWHGGRAASQYDKWRDRQLARRGWMAVRVTDEDLARRFDATVREIVELYSARQTA